MLYRPCLSVPVLFTGELGPNGNSSRGRAAERGFGGRKVSAEEEERVYMTVAEAGSKVLRLYRQLHRVHQVNYTFLATHHLFMAGNYHLQPRFPIFGLTLTLLIRDLVPLLNLALSIGSLTPGHG